MIEKEKNTALNMIDFNKMIHVLRKKMNVVNYRPLGSKKKATQTVAGNWQSKRKTRIPCLTILSFYYFKKSV